MYDIVIIGAGPGGYTAALTAAAKKARVALVEQGEIGGVCLNRGCIPTKSLLSSASSAQKTSWQDSLKAMREQIAQLETGLEKLLTRSGVDIIKGRAIIKSPDIVEVDGDALNCKSIILATGSKPMEIPMVKTDGVKIINSDHIWNMEQLPESAIILGGGVVGCEFADFLTNFGVKVSIVELMPRLVPWFDSQISQILTRSFTPNIDVRTGIRAIGIEPTNEGVTMMFEGGESINAEKMIISVGRRPIVEPEVVQALNLDMHEGFITVDSELRTSVPNVFAIGDVTGGYMLAHAAEAHGKRAALMALGEIKQNPKAFIEPMPACVYTEPELASIGMTRAQARKQKIKCVEGKAYYLANGRAVAAGHTEGVVKIVAMKSSGQILGVHICGACATEMIATAAVAMNMQVGVRQLTSMIWAHPTYSELLSEAAAKCLEKVGD